MSEETFTAWACKSKSAPLEPMEMTFCHWDDDMVQMDVICCGVCGTDLHTVDEGWGPTEFPCVVGHEIIGNVTKVGKNVTRIKVGDRCGVGCQSASCGKCDFCKKGMENLCSTHAVWTFNDRYDNATKDKTYGGFAKKWRGNQDFVVHVPMDFSPEVAASFLCGGVTTYAPLKRYGVGKGSKVVSGVSVTLVSNGPRLWVPKLLLSMLSLTRSMMPRSSAVMTTFSCKRKSRWNHTTTHLLTSLPPRLSTSVGTNTSRC
uniref:Truncated alcohol dehydrogenase 1 n=1 Tax=Mucor circinelloides TaxID=36080 RepID=A0A3Q9DZT7_MUCCI|nr:truncated alcohol dehydrogenase 1 [Mucor circinelloides]